MRILITGHTGFLGKSLLEKFKQEDVLTVGREWNSDPGIRTAILRHNPEYIIHCAAEIKDPSRTFEANILMLNWLLGVTAEVDYKAFVNIGSSSEYGHTLVPMTERELLKPRTMYEATKGAGTLLCQGFAREYSKPIVTIRPFSLYGPHEPQNRLIPTLFRNFRNNVVSSISSGVHDFIHIEDFIEGLTQIMHSEKELIKGDVVHLGSGVQHTNVEVYHLIKNIFNSQLDYCAIDNIFNKYDSLNWVADVTYARTKYNFNPKYDLAAGLNRLYETTYK
jgi:nucleoside-diphosphate-sugar epimerase